MDQHKAAVSKLAKEVSSFHTTKTPFWIYHGSTNCTRALTLSRSRIIDTSTLNHVLHISPEDMTVIAEPNVSMDVLVKETLKHGLIPPVIPEFPGITVGGAFSGTAGESSSFRYGYFDRTVRSVEIILANGEVVTASQEGERSDLFNGAAGAFGTLGVLTLFEIQLVEARKYVELTYLPVGDAKDAIATMKCCTESGKEFDFVDGIQFSKSSGVVCVGRMTDTCASTSLQTFSGAWDPWFYMHAQSYSSPGNRKKPLTDTIPLQDYLFRYDRGAFWMGKYYPLFQPWEWMNNRWARWFWDDFLHTRVLFQSMHISNRSQKFVIQDLGLPVETAEEFLEFVDEEFGIYPLWLCPLKIGQEVNFQRIGGGNGKVEEGMKLNIGVWGPGAENFRTFVQDNRRLEKRLGELGGRKWLYAHTYYTEEEFWALYDRGEYEGLRGKYCAKSLPDVFGKVRSTETEFPRRDLKATWAGIWGHLLGGKVQYLLDGEKVK